MEPLVSILIPVYNAEKWLGQTLGSALDQTWPRKEIIVIDDGSTDDSFAIARGFAASNTLLIQAEHRGQTATLNRALIEAQGRYIQFLDADDLLAPDKMEIQIRRLMSESPSAISTCSWERFYNGDFATARFYAHKDYCDYSSPVDWLIQSWSGHGTMPPVAWLLNRSVVEKCGPFNETLSLNNDTEFFTRAVLKCSKIAFCPDAHAYYRSGNSSLSGRRARAALESFFRACELCTRELSLFEDSGRTRHACASLWQHFAYWTYPDAPDLVKSAEEKARLLGGTDVNLQGSVRLNLLINLLGWKAARKVQRAYYRLRYGL